MTIETAPDTVIKFHHLLDLCRAMRLAQKGNLATGERPDPETAMRLETALDFFIAEWNSRNRKRNQYRGVEN